MITIDELKKLVEKVGGSMTEGEARGLIHQADKDGNEGIDFSEFSKLWAAIKGGGEVRISMKCSLCTIQYFDKVSNFEMKYLQKL